MKQTLQKFSIFFFLLFVSIFLSENASAGYFRVFYRDKGPLEFKPGSKLYEETMQSLSQRAINRRLKVLTPSNIISIEDAPVCQNYIDSVVRLGAKFRYNLKWKNYSIFDCDSITAEMIKTLTFISKVQPTSSKISELKMSDEMNSLKSFIHDELFLRDGFNCGSYGYGDSRRQVEILGILPLHEAGITGSGTLIGFLDSGFRWRFLEALKNTRVINEYDFVLMDSLTSNKPIDVSDQDHHGTITLSTVAGFLPDTLIGISNSSDFILAKTEDIRTETRIEEDNYAVALEWFESQGVDVTSSSLGYLNYDSTETKYLESDLDGETTIVASAVNSAVKRGMVCVTAAGNKGPAPRTINSPGDADSSIAVAAVGSDSLAANFSSRGPAYQHKLKPDVAAMGVATVGVNPSNSSVLKANGTSLSTPLIAGSVSLLISVFPELKPYQIRNLLFDNASQKNRPDTILGYGIPDIYKSMLSYGIIISPISTYSLKQFQRVAVFIMSKNALLVQKIFVKFSQTSGFEPYVLKPSKYENLFFADLPLANFGNKPAEGYISARDMIGSRRSPYNEGETFIITPDEVKVPCGVDKAKIFDISPESKDLFVYPSLLKDNQTMIKISITQPTDSDVEIEIINDIGQNAFFNYYRGEYAGFNSFLINVSNLASGVYFVRAAFSGKTETGRFIITR